MFFFLFKINFFFLLILFLLVDFYSTAVFDVAYFYFAGGGSKYLTGCLKLLTVGYYSVSRLFLRFRSAPGKLRAPILFALTRMIFHDFEEMKL